jgi:DnaK suppressor protein
MDTQAALVQQRDELRTSIQFYRGDLHIEKNADPMDQTTAEANREESGREVSRKAASLREVEEALERIADGSYGICLDCDEPIPPKRLAIRPAAARCVACQERQDRLDARKVN